MLELRDCVVKSVRADLVKSRVRVVVEVPLQAVRPAVRELLAEMVGYEQLVDVRVVEQQLRMPIHVEGMAEATGEEG